MLAAISWQTLSTGQRPWPAMKQHAGAGFAWAWATRSQQGGDFDELNVPFRCVATDIGLYCSCLSNSVSR